MTPEAFVGVPETGPGFRWTRRPDGVLAFGERYFDGSICYVVTVDPEMLHNAPNDTLGAIADKLKRADAPTRVIADFLAQWSAINNALDLYGST